MGVQPLPQMREVCFLCYVQCQRGIVSGLCAVGGRVPLVLSSLRRPPPGTGRLLLPHLWSKIAGGRHRRKGGSRRMTNYDLRTRKALRQVTLLEYGCGPETLRRRKICPSCGRANSAGRTALTAARYCRKRPSMTSTSPATAAAPAAVWLSPTTRCTARSAGRACRRQA